MYQYVAPVPLNIWGQHLKDQWHSSSYNYACHSLAQNPEDSLFLTGVTKLQHPKPLCIPWKSTHQVWISQCSLNKVELRALTNLVEEQLKLAHIETLFSEWNYSVFVLQKFHEHGDY